MNEIERSVDVLDLSNLIIIFYLLTQGAEVRNTQPGAISAGQCYTIGIKMSAWKFTECTKRLPFVCEKQGNMLILGLSSCVGYFQ